MHLDSPEFQKQIENFAKYNNCSKKIARSILIKHTLLNLLTDTINIKELKAILANVIHLMEIRDEKYTIQQEKERDHE